MPSRIISVFGSYDFYGKSFPGMAFLAGILTLIPATWIFRFETENLPETLAFFVILLTIIVLLGTLIGEAVHALGIYIENSVAWFGNRIKNMVELGRDEECIPSLERVYQPITNPKQPDEEEQIGYSLTRRILQNWKYGILNWINRRLEGIRLALIRHRILFTSKITRPLGLPEEGPKERNVSDLDAVQQYLVETAEDEFAVESKEDASCVYPVVVTALASNEITRPDEFQARYSFCRSMWVTLLLMTLSYSLLSAFPYVTLIEYLFPQWQNLVPVFILFLLFFLISAGKYKKHYVEYLMSGFYIAGDDISVTETSQSNEMQEGNNIRKRIRDKIKLIRKWRDT